MKLLQPMCVCVRMVCVCVCVCTCVHVIFLERMLQKLFGKERKMTISQPQRLKESWC